VSWNWKVSLVIIGSCVLWAVFAPREPPEVILDPIIVHGPPGACVTISGPLKWNQKLVWFSVLCPEGVRPDAIRVR
jgi:hypothetical protein